MFKKLLQLFPVLMLIALQVSTAQEADTIHARCGLTPERIESMGVLINEPNIPIGYPATAKQACGKFMVYYDDVAYSTGGGFDEAAGSLGATRRSTLCSVLTYVQSVYDFNNIPTGQYIRLHVDSSYTPSSPPATGRRGAYLGYGAPFFTRPTTAGSIVNGYVWDYTMTGIDPAPGFYHGELRMNFEYTSRGTAVRLKEVRIEYQNGLDSVQNCQFDFFSTLLHSVSHTLGYYSMTRIHHGGIWTPGTYTTLDTSITTSASPYTDPTAFSTPLTKAYSTGSIGVLWMDNAPAPYRIGMDFGGHTSQIYKSTRVGAGDYQSNVMGEYFIEGLMSRSYSKEELRLGHNILGYAFNPATFASSSQSAFYYNNHRPYCSKNFDFRYNGYFFNNYFYMDTVTADFIMTNNTGSSLSINIGADTSLHDDDGDTIRIIPGSVFNLRGCGINGNNHNALSLSNGNRTVTYTPRPNFYGRAQFAMNITDGKEKGTLIYYTIDVKKGSNVYVPYGQNLVLNGGFEDGTEVKIKDSFERVNNTSLEDATFEGRFNDGLFYNDAAPYSNSPVVRNSYVECEDLVRSTTSFGSPLTSFPWPWDTLTIFHTLRYPESVGGKGNRYCNSPFPNMMNLGDSVRGCRNYLLEFDAYRILKLKPPTLFVYPEVDTIYVGFTTDKHTIKTAPNDAHMIQRIKPYTTTALKTWEWVHFSIPFSYCSDSAANILFLRVAGADGSDRKLDVISPGSWYWIPTFLMDNVSLKEVPFTVSIKDSNVDACVYRVRAIPSDTSSCNPPVTYTWTTLSGKVISTASTFDLAPQVTTTYILTASNGCQTAKDTVVLQGIICPCGPGASFGDTSTFYTLKGAMKTIPAYNAYYVAEDLTITGNSQFLNANVQVKPGVRINVTDSVLLTIDSSHLFTCQDNAMWKGIRLLSAATKSGRILLKNNSMIEDADTAVKAVNPKIPATGAIVNSTNTTYNRNYVDVFISGLTAVSPANYPFNFGGNVFTARKFSGYVARYPLSWPKATTLRQTMTAVGAIASYNLTLTYPVKQLCKSTSFSFGGIVLNGVGFTNMATGDYSEIEVGDSLITGNHNVFDNHQYGINVFNTNLRVYNNHFINIAEKFAPNTYSGSAVNEGSGIFSMTDPTGSGKYRLLVLPNQTRINRFHDCVKGVYFKYIYQAEVRSCFITSSHVYGAMMPGANFTGDVDKGYGIYAAVNYQLNNYVINDNTISNIPYGIMTYYTTMFPGSYVEIRNNKLYGNNPDLGTITGQYLGTGISAPVGIAGTASGTLKVNENTMTAVRNGIFFSVSGGLQLTAEHNIIDIKNDGLPIDHIGINIKSATKAKVTVNEVNTSAITNEYFKAYAIADSKNTAICGNKERNMGRGFQFGGVGPQPGTIWAGNSMEGSQKGFVLASDIGHQIISSSGPFGLVMTAGDIWKGSWPLGTAHTYTDGAPIKSINSKLYVRNITSGLIERPVLNQGNPPTNQYFFTGTPSGSIITTGASSYSCNQVASPFPYPFFGGGLTASILADTMGYDADWQPTQWMAQFNLWKEGIMDQNLSDSSQLFAQFMNLATATRFKWLTDIEQALAIEDIGLAQGLLNNPTPAMGRAIVSPELVITDIPEADYVVQHYTDYYGLYIKFLQGTMDSTDIEEVHAIASLCPPIHGAVVYQARNLYQGITDRSEEYPDDSCVYSSGRNFRLSINIVQQSYSLYPNPNNGYLFLKQQIKDAEPVQLHVYDLQGRLVYQSVLNFGNKQEVAVEMRAIIPGLYLLQLQDNKGNLYSLKSNIQ